MYILVYYNSCFNIIISIGIFGGSSVGFLSIKDTKDASLFCSNCSFSSEYSSGYQNDKGFATSKFGKRLCFIKY